MSIHQRQLTRLAGSLLASRRRGGRGSVVTILLILAILAVGYFQKQSPGTFETVTDVLDGDSLVIFQDGQRREIRLYAIDAPEKGQAYGQEARAFTTRLVKGKPVTLTIQDTDRYGRLVSAVVLEDGRSLNQALVEAGMAWWYRDHAEGNRVLSRLEEEARQAGRGLWADADPEPPWDFRRRQRDE